MTKKGITSFGLSIQDSMIVKGVAICLMLWHHLFLEHPEYGEIMLITALLGKVCVSLFVMVSGYGLAIQQEKEFSGIRESLSLRNIFSTYFKRLTKLYANYWLVFIIFVPLGVYVFNRPLSAAYGDTNTYVSLVVDVLGLANLKSYNSTWWFYRLIIGLYILFPFLYAAVKRWNIYVLCFFFALLYVYMIDFENFFYPYVTFTFAFVIGISWALNRERITLFVNYFRFDRVCFFAVLGLLITMFFRMNFPFFGIQIDSFYAFFIVLTLLVSVRSSRIASPVFQFLGQHSMNIFMVHTFIHVYYFPTFIYSLGNPFLMFVVLLGASLGISLVIEFAKEKLGFYALLGSRKRA